jgi:alkanesulfonate monooxygenase SsuD/methylene tetrahydromethanopterin reductase-like flavin-dependent oxidoreductase (luciferase family)
VSDERDGPRRGGRQRVVLGAAAIPEPDRDWLAAVERLPVGSVWQGGHLLPPGPTGEAITRLALMAAWTERVRVGTSVLLLPLYHPVIAAKQLADLDSRSGGRVTVGVGVGGEFRAEFDAVGIPLAERGARTDESIEVLRTLWRSASGKSSASGEGGASQEGGPVSFQGKFFSFTDVELRPVRAAGGAGGMRPSRAAARGGRPQGGGDAPRGPAGRRVDAVPGLAGRVRSLGTRDQR